MTHRILLLALCCILCAAPAAATPVTKAAATHPAAAFVQKLGDKALVSLTDKGLSRAAREDRTRDLLRGHFDVQTIGRFALGPHWRDASAAQKAEYFSLFESMIVDTYTSRFEEYSGQSFQVDGALDSGEKDAIVSSRIVQKDGPPVSIEWRVRRKNGDMKIVDVVVENISMSVTQRSDFGAVIQRGGGKMDALLSSLRDRKKKNTASR